MTKLRKLLLTIFNTKRTIALIPLTVSFLFVFPAYADDKSDFDDFKDKYEDLADKYDDLNDQVKDFLEVSKDLRRMDEEELQSLIKGICELDIETRNDDATTIANDLVFDSVSTVSQFYIRLENDGNELLNSTEELMEDQKSLRNKYTGLKDSGEVGSDATSLISELTKLIEKTTRRYGEVSDNSRSLTNIKDGTMKGTNNPKIRAKLEYGKKKHEELQRSCDESEVSVSGGRADCVNFDKDACSVIEFKPNTYTESEAKNQAARYLDGIRSKYRTDSRAVENCKKDSDGDPIFEAKGQLYTACRP